MRVRAVKPPELLTRMAMADDMAFVRATWMQSHVFKARDRTRAHSGWVFQKTYIAPILAERPRIVVLCSPDRPSALHGHAVAIRDALAWVYVPFDLRGHGYGRQVITAALGGYPETIPVHCAWPWPSARFVFRKYERHRAA